MHQIKQKANFPNMTQNKTKRHDEVFFIRLLLVHLLMFYNNIYCPVGQYCLNCSVFYKDIKNKIKTENPSINPSDVCLSTVETELRIDLEQLGHMT